MVKHAMSAVCCCTWVFLASAVNVSIFKQLIRNNIRFRSLDYLFLLYLSCKYGYNRDWLFILYYHNKIYLSLIFERINRIRKEPNRNSKLQICLSFQHHKSLWRALRVPKKTYITYAKFPNSKLLFKTSKPLSSTDHSLPPLYKRPKFSKYILTKT